MLASTASVTSNIAVSIDGFFSTRISRLLTPARDVAAPTGTTAPFSAMSGPVTVTSLLSVGALAPRAFMSSGIVLAAKAAVLKAPACACATAGSMPTAASMVATLADWESISRRVCMEVS